MKPEEVVHIGDDRRNDLWGARDAGCDAWLWGSDVYSFKEVSNYPFSLLLSTLCELQTNCCSTVLWTLCLEFKHLVAKLSFLVSL